MDNLKEYFKSILLGDSASLKHQKKCLTMRLNMEDYIFIHVLTNHANISKSNFVSGIIKSALDECKIKVDK